MANTTSKSAPQLDANFSISNDPPTEELYYGSIKVWKNKDGQFHRDGGLPAIEFANGNKFYYKNGKNHRDGVDLPAIEFANGDRSYLEMVFFIVVAISLPLLRKPLMNIGLTADTFSLLNTTMASWLRLRFRLK